MSANAAECPPANAPVSVRRRKMHFIVVTPMVLSPFDFLSLYYKILFVLKLKKPCEVIHQLRTVFYTQDIF